MHDVACDAAGHDFGKRRKADKMFYHACRAGGCFWKEAVILYLGVRIGGIWPFVPKWSALALSEEDRPRLARTATEAELESDFARAGEMVLARGETDDVDEIERRADEALSLVTGLSFRSGRLQ